MAYQMTFKRYEIKYMLSLKQQERLLDLMKSYMRLDQYGKTTIRNIYYDNDNYRLIRRSMEKPLYKEKLRIRSYKKSKPDSTVFVEIKKKYDHIVYKRRVCMSEQEATNWLSKDIEPQLQNQITNEINYFKKYYQHLSPKVLLSYNRMAYYDLQGSDFRITFDDNILARTIDISLKSEVYGTLLLEEDQVLMEVKCSGGMPMWLVKFLSEEKIYKTSFSKYGKAYEKLIFNKQKNNQIYEEVAISA